MDREPMTDKERDDALIAEKKRLAYFLECKEGTVEAEAMFRRAAALLRGDEPAKPDRYVDAAREFLAAWGERVLAVDQGEYDGDKRFQVAAAVLRRHFEPPSEVVEWAKKYKEYCRTAHNLRISDEMVMLMNFILKGDQ